ncbi:MAG: TerD family protein [Treponema sp.]|jgi:tellurite resistance protein TerA|nr:TerD family protein [Treponema sp.]
MAVELTKGTKISLTKPDKRKGLGEIVVNLKWNQGSPKKKGFFAALISDQKGGGGIDLDLGCLFELTDGSKGAVQALGNSFGNLNEAPFVSLDGDDRTGESAEGETLRINGNMIANIKRILVYTFIYEGAANWQQTDGIVTIKYPGNEDIVVRLDEYGSNLSMCGLVFFENQKNETFSVEKQVKFFNGHEALDRAFGWGMQWVSGKKD